MNKAATVSICALLLLTVIPTKTFSSQQRNSNDLDSAYSSKFFEDLRTIFGRFQNADLQRAFRDAQPIQCSELVGHNGEWRPVAFFNEDRTLGDWCRESLEEVKADLAVYTFKGTCGNDGDVQVITEFPTTEGLEAYRLRRIDLNKVDITVNDPVSAALNTETMAYTFDLPYLFLKERAPRKVYSLVAPDRNAAYATDVSSHWECKAVASKDVTYRFMICRVSTVPRQKLRKNETWEPVFGSSAFFILSDGTEAQTSVNMSFGDVTEAGEKPKGEEEIPPPGSAPGRPVLKKR